MITLWILGLAFIGCIFVGAGAGLGQKGEMGSRLRRLGAAAAILAGVLLILAAFSLVEDPTEKPPEPAPSTSAGTAAR